jgi:hypothetical protein
MFGVYRALASAEQSLTKTKMKQNKTKIAATVVFLLAFLLVPNALAVGTGTVVINEVAWAGSLDSANDEWIELFNPGTLPVDLTGWKITDDQGASVYSLSGTISSGGYYLIEDSEIVVQPLVADLIANLSLSNSGDSLVMTDSTGQVIDSVNGTGGMWFAGDSVSRATMERIDPAVSGDDPTNWAASNGSGSTAVSSLGSFILGTPGKVNSKAATAAVTSVDFSLSSQTPAKGDTVTLYVDVGGVTDLFSYGVEIDYDPDLLSFQTAGAAGFLSGSGSAVTTFESGLENGTEGKLLIAEARTIDPKSGVSGSGRLFSADFTVTGDAGMSGNITKGAASFLGGISGDISSGWNGAQFTVTAMTVAPVTGASVSEDAQRYALKVGWTAPLGGADGYKVLRKNPHGIWIQLGQPTETSFVDSDAVAAGGKIIPQLQYCYRIVAMKGAMESTPVEVCGTETRGLKADNDRSDRVDGRDLDKLARHFAEMDTSAGFDPLTDTNYDGQVDGSDLIDLGADFARVYAP